MVQLRCNGYKTQRDFFENAKEADATIDLTSDTEELLCALASLAHAQLVLLRHSRSIEVKLVFRQIHT